MEEYNIRISVETVRRRLRKSGAMTQLPLPPKDSPQNVVDAQVLYERIKTIALWLDSIPINGYNLPIGLEAIFGLLPAVGDIIGLVLGMYQVYLTSFFDIPAGLLMRMIMHVLIDFIIGILPFVGDLLDFFYKSNIYNLNLLETWLNEKYGSRIKVQNNDRGNKYQRTRNY
ncbi:8700_t:CDS:2 [Funneliformis geosporum]|uniref:12326_t:CDS:1 n=1 Tax=Funneliformis geosporum TaxID=1117311 RepID=A0A9W4SU68_9GLOM|nr:12326_t:CDS:2 [Funneliformis geosporum]CAI2183069.1 8700_t:CDS:2 [Funneliformis geosporum]